MEIKINVTAASGLDGETGVCLLPCRFKVVDGAVVAADIGYDSQYRIMDTGTHWAVEKVT